MLICEIIENPRKILKNLASEDQAERNEYNSFVKNNCNNDYSKCAKIWAKKKNRSEDDIFGDKQRLSKFMKLVFDFEIFNEEDWHAYWLLSQHCDYDRQFQSQALQNILKHLGNDHYHYKYLADRISCGLNGTQKYNTQNICQKDEIT